LHSKALVKLDQVDTRVHDKLENTLSCFTWLFSYIVNSLEQNQKWNRESLRGSETHWVKSAHETVKGSLLKLSNFFVLFEEVEWHNTRDVFSTDTNCKLTLVFQVKSASCILMLLEVEDTGVQEAVKGHKLGDDLADNQLSGVTDYGLASLNVKSKTHAISSL